MLAGHSVRQLLYIPRQEHRGLTRRVSLVFLPHRLELSRDGLDEFSLALLRLVDPALGTSIGYLAAIRKRPWQRPDALRCEAPLLDAVHAASVVQGLPAAGAVEDDPSIGVSEAPLQTRGTGNVPAGHDGRVAVAFASFLDGEDRDLADHAQEVRGPVDGECDER